MALWSHLCLMQGFPALALWTFGATSFFVMPFARWDVWQRPWPPRTRYLEHPWSIVTTRNVSSLCQVSPVEPHWSNAFIFQIRKLRHKERRRLARGHTASWVQTGLRSRALVQASHEASLFLFLKDLFIMNKRESTCAHSGEGQRGRVRQNPKQTPC